jgi:hypothetical protein
VSRTFTTNKADGVLQLTSSANPAYIHRWVTFTMAVTSTVPFTPGGIVTFTLNQHNITKSLTMNARAIYATNTLSLGMYAVTATYGGDLHFGSADTTLSGGQMIIDLLKVFMPIVRR